MRKRITKRTVDAVEPGTRPVFLWDTDVTGFGLKVTPAGKRVYICQYRQPGEGSKTAPKRITLGVHGQLTPDKARKKAAKVLLEVKAGKDPRRTLSDAPSPTVADLAERFLTEYLPKKKHPPRPSTITYYEGLFRCHVLPVLGEKKVEAVTAAEVEQLHTRMRGTPYVANRTLSLIQHAFDQAEAWGWREQHSNPAIRIERYREERRGAKKEVMLTPEQMARLLRTLDEAERRGTNPTSVAAIRLAFWTGWRIGEVLRLEWRNLELKRGTAKLVKTKTADEEYRQLPAEAISILEALPRVAGCPYVFPGADLQSHLTTVRKPWARIRERARLASLDGLGPLRIHDLRHNVVSWDVSRGVPLEIAGKNVGHRSRRATEVYAHFAPDALKRAADDRARAMRSAVEGAQGTEGTSVRQNG